MRSEHPVRIAPGRDASQGDHRARTWAGSGRDSVAATPGYPVRERHVFPGLMRWVPQRYAGAHDLCPGDVLIATADHESRRDERAVGPVAWPRLVVAACSGAMLALAYGLEPVWFAAWLGAIPLLVVAASLRLRSAAALGAVAGAVASVSLFGLHWNEAGPVDAVVLAFARSAQWAFVASAARVGSSMLPTGLGVLAAPIALGASEFLSNSAPSLGGVVVVVGHLHALPTHMLAALGGAPAAAFLVALVASFATVAFTPAQRTVRRVAVPLASRVGAFGGGCPRVKAARASTPRPGTTRRVAGDATTPGAIRRQSKGAAARRPSLRRARSEERR